MRLTVIFMLNTKVFLNLRKKTDYKYMISLFATTVHTNYKS